jgi:uncharacterized protein YhaN
MSMPPDERFAKLEEAIAFADRESERTRESLDEVLRQLASIERRLSALERRFDAMDQGPGEVEPEGTDG